MTIDDAIAVATAFRLWMDEFVDQAHLKDLVQDQLTFFGSVSLKRYTTKTLLAQRCHLQRLGRSHKSRWDQSSRPVTRNSGH